MRFKDGPRIYNLFPRLVGSMDRWLEHLPRIREMGFDWVYVNPWHYAGYSGSLYAVKDYYAYHPLFVNANLAATPEEQLRGFIDAAHGHGLKVMMDLVVNHTAFDSVLATEHPEWFQKDEAGQLKRPGCMDGDVWIEWGDLVQLDNAASPDRQGLWSYWLGVMRHYLSLGVDGFRADAAYHVPAELWEFLIPAVRHEFPLTEFFAETLGCRPWEVIACADAGFDYVFNSVRWWDLDAAWLLEAHNKVVGAAPSIGFPESHDTQRLADELVGDGAAVMQRYTFAALFSTGVLVPVGFEFGFRTRLDVVETYPDAWEAPSLDLTGPIKAVNALKSSARVFNLDGTLLPIKLEGEPSPVRCYVKSTPDAREKALFLINLDREAAQPFHLKSAADAAGIRSLWDVTPDGEPWGLDGEDLRGELAPAAIRVFLGTMSPAPSPEGAREPVKT